MCEVCTPGPGWEGGMGRKWGRGDVGTAKPASLSFLDLHSLLPTAEGVGTSEVPVLNQIPCKGVTEATAQQSCGM